MELGKCHLFFSCGTMKFFLFLLFLLLLFDSLQGSTISHKRSIRALNTTLETNFNGTYERRNPCTNVEIERTSYVASHEFCHHTEENDWNDYTHKCSAIISSFLRALGNLVHFNNKQNGNFNFHINTTISQKQDGHCEPDKRTSCDTLPTITIEATDCESSPRLSCDNVSDEQLCQDQKEERKEKETLNEEICQENQVLSEKSPREPNFNQNSVISTPQSHTEGEIKPIQSLDVPVAEDEEKLLEAENVWNVDDIFLPATETNTSLEPEFPTAGFVIGTKNSPQEISDASKSATPTDFQTEENFNVPSSSHSHFEHRTVIKPIADGEPFYPNQFSDPYFGEQQPTVYSKQLFDDNLDRQVPDSELLPNQQPDTSFILPNPIAKAPFIPQESNPIEIQQPKNMAFEENPLPLQQQFPVVMGQNEESYQQSLQNGKQFDNFEEIHTGPNTDISSETETISYLPQKYLTKSEEVPFNQITNAGPLQVSNLTPNERQFMDYDGQTSALKFFTSYPIPSTQVPPIKSTSGKALTDQDNHRLQKTAKEKIQAIDYSDEFFKAQPALEDNLDSLTLNESSPNNNQGVPSFDDVSTFSISRPLTDPTASTFSERFPTEDPFYDVNDNQFLSTPTPERPSFQFSNESPFLTSESQKSVLYYSEENSDESNIDKATDAELLSPSDQYQSIARPESQSLLNYPDQYDNVEEANLDQIDSNFSDPLVQLDSEVTTSKPYFQSFSTIPEYQTKGFISFSEAASSLQYPTDTTSNPKFSSSHDSASDYESLSSSKSETFSDEYLTTLPPKQDSFENSQKILSTFDPYQDQTPFPSALEEKFLPTKFPPGQIINDDAISPTLKSELPPNDIYTSPSPAPTSFDDYQDSLYSKSHLESSFTTPMQHFDEDTFEPGTEPYLTNNQKSYSDESQSTIPTISDINQLKQKSSSYPDLTLQQPLNYASDTLIQTQNYDIPKSQRHQFFEKSEDSLPDEKTFSTRQYNDFSTESFKTKNSMNYDSEVPSDSFGPQMEQYPNDNILIFDQSKQNVDIITNFAENFPEENQTIFSPQPFMPDNNEELFPDRSSFRNIETTSSPVFNAADDLEPIINNNYQKVDFPEKFPKDSDARPKKLFSELFTTPLPPVSFPPEDFLSPSNYKTISGDSLTQNQTEESLASLDQSVNKNFSPKFEEPPRAFLAPFKDVNKFDSDFPTEKNLKQPFELATSEKESTQSTIPVYESQSDEPFYYFNGAESFIPYAGKQYIAADSPKVQKVFFSEQKSFPKPLMSDLPEHENTTSSDEKFLTEGSTESELYNYSKSDSDNFESHPAVDQQKTETIDQESILNYSNRFSDSSSKKPSTNFFPSFKRPLIQNAPDSSKEQTEFYLDNQQPTSDFLEPQSLISTTVSNDQSRSSELQSSSIPKSQLESISSFSDSKPSEQAPLDISLPTIPLALTKNQELQSNNFKIPGSLVSAPFNQPQKVATYTSYPTEDFSKDSQSSSVEDLESVVSSESHSTKSEIYRNKNRAPNRQIADNINAFQSSKQEPETYNQFPSAALLQPTKFYDKKAAPSKNYSSTLKSSSQMEPSVHDYNKQVFKPYSESNFAPIPQPYQYQSEPSSQALLEECSDTTSTAETEIPLDVDETTASSTPQASSLHTNEQSESQYIQKKLSDYSSSFASEQQLKPQPSYNYISDIPDKNLTETLILSSPQTSNSENIPFFEVKPDKSTARGSYPNQEHTGAYEQDAAGYNQYDYNQPKYKELDYFDESPSTDFDLPVGELSNPPQSLTASPPLDSVPHVQFRFNDFTPFPQSPASTSHQLNNNLNKSSQKSGDIPFRYPQSKKEISFVTDNISPQPRPTTAVYNDEEKTEMLSVSKPQPQMSLNSSDKFSDDKIPKQLSNLPRQHNQITSAAALSSEVEPIRQRNTMGFGTSDNDASNQPSFSFQSQAKQLDAMTDSLDQTQKNFDSKLSSRVSNASPLYTATTIQNQRDPSIINSEHLYNSQEQFSPYNRRGSQPNFNNRPISVEYQRDRPTQPVDRFPSNDSPLESKYFNEAFQYPEARRLTAPRYRPRGLNPRDEFQTQPSLRYPNDIPPINRFPPVASKHSATQRFDPQLYPTNFPNPNSNHNVRAPLNMPISNLYNNEPARQINRASPQYFRSDARSTQNLFESPLLLNADQYSKGSETEQLPDQTIKNADSSLYDDYDQALSTQLPDEKLLEYDEDITPKFYIENPTYRQHGKDMVKEKSRQSADDFLAEADPPLEFNQKAETYDFQDRSSPNNEPSSYSSSPVEKEPHSNPLLHTLERHLTFPFKEHLRPSASYASSTDAEEESLKHSFSFDPRHQNEFQDASAIPFYSEGRDSESDFVDYQRSQPLNEVDTAQDVKNTRQPDSQVLVSDPNIPSNKPGEDYVSCFGQNPTPLLCPLDPIFKGNMTAPSYYILISKQSADDDKEEQFKVEKVYLGDGMPLNCTLSTGKTFPTSLYTPIPFSTVGTVKLRTKSDFA